MLAHINRYSLIHWAARVACILRETKLETQMTIPFDQNANITRTHTILIIDDSPTQCKLIEKRLVQWGYEVQTVNGGYEALCLCKEKQFDFVLSDWMMPEMDGLEFCQHFRELPRSGYGYFILLTSKNDKADIAKGLECGADDFLSKPVNGAELHARLKAGARILRMEKRLQVEIQKSNQAYDQLSVINRAIKKDLKHAERLQRSLIPERSITGQGFTISNIFQSSAHVGGDLLGTFELDEQRHVIYSIDVSGHGVSSALLTMHLHSLLSPYSRQDNIVFGDDGLLNPRTLAEVLNQRMLSNTDTDLYFTMAYADINLRTGRVEMVQAGHPHPLLLSGKKPAKLLGDGGLPIGLIGGIDFEQVNFKMKHGDKLLLYSDGLSECENPKGKQLDDHGLAEIFTQLHEKSGAALLDDLYAQVRHFTQGKDFDDDISAILFEYE